MDWTKIGSFIAAIIGVISGLLKIEEWVAEHLWFETPHRRDFLNIAMAFLSARLNPTLVT